MTEERLLVGTVILLVVALVGAIVAGCFFVINKGNEQKIEDIKAAAHYATVWHWKISDDSLVELYEVSEVPGEVGLGRDFHINKSLTKAYNLLYFRTVPVSSGWTKMDPNAQVKRATVMVTCSSKKDRQIPGNWKTKIVKIDDYSGSWESLKDIGPARYSEYLGSGTEYKVEYGEVFPWNDHHSQEVQTPDNPPLPPPPPPPSVPRCYK